MILSAQFNRCLLVKAVLVGMYLTGSLLAGEQVRFSSGPIHSGTVEFALDVEGATRLSISVDPPESRIEWLEAVLVDATGKRTELSKTEEDGAAFAKAGFRKLIGRARVNGPAKGNSTTEIHIRHDAPRPGSAGGLPVEKLLELTGDPARGRGVFFGRGTCTSCHAIEGRGANIGPDLSSLGKRSELSAIVESLVSPDAALAAGFETSIVTTEDGTPHLGFIVSDAAERLVLKDTGGQSHEIEKEKIVSRKPQTFSLMPPFGDLLSPQQIADLAAFLKAQRR